MLDLEAKIKMRITKKQGGIIGGAVAVVLIAAAIGVHAHYQNRWYPGSTFNKVDVSGMTYEESVKKVKKSIDSYKLKIKGRNNGQEVISGKEIDLAFKTESHVKDAYKKQHSQSVFSTIFGGKKNKVTAVALSEQKLKAKLKQSVLIKGSDTYKITKPVERIREVTLRGTKEIVLPAGAEVYSDEVEVTVKAGDRIAVNIYIDQQQKIQNLCGYWAEGGTVSFFNISSKSKYPS